MPSIACTAVLLTAGCKGRITKLSVYSIVSFTFSCAISQPSSSVKAEANTVGLDNKKNVVGNGMFKINFVLIKNPGIATELLGVDFAMIVGDFKEKRRGLRMNYYPNL